MTSHASLRARLVENHQPCYHFAVSGDARKKPLILITNDDGIESPGLRASAQAALSLGDVLVVAPSRQWSGAGRSLPQEFRAHTETYPLEVGAQSLQAHRVDGSPAAGVLYALLEVAPRVPDLLICGINYGANVGADITTSGTVGAALEGATSGLPALAVSVQTPKGMHLRPSLSVDFAAGVHFTALFARYLLRVSLPFDVDVLKVDIPSDATPETPWRVTRVSRHTYFAPASTQTDDRTRAAGLDYDVLPHPERAEPDSDIYALAVDRVVSVAPLSYDLTSRIDREMVDELLRRTLSPN